MRNKKHAEKLTKINLAILACSLSLSLYFPLCFSPPTFSLSFSLPHTPISNFLCLSFHCCACFWVFSLDKLSHHHIAVIHFQGTAIKRVTRLRLLYCKSPRYGNIVKEVRQIHLVKCSARCLPCPDVESLGTSQCPVLFLAPLIVIIYILHGQN